MNGMRITRVKDLSRSGGTWAALALAATAAITVTAGASGAESPRTENSNASRAIATVTTANASDAATTIPADFAAFAGYTPTVVVGYLANPHGDCSSRSGC